MIVKENFYNIECDCCHCFINEDTWCIDEQYVKEDVLNNDWREFEGKHYCPNCWKLDDDDNIVTKDGKVWDRNTGELIKTIEE